MQSVDKNGILGKVQEFNEGELAKFLEDKDIDHVDVFKGTPENILHRKKLQGKKYRPSKGYQKAPSIKKKK